MKKPGKLARCKQFVLIVPNVRQFYVSLNGFCNCDFMPGSISRACDTMSGFIAGFDNCGLMTGLYAGKMTHML